MLVLVGNPEDRFSYNATHIKMITAILWVYQNYEPRSEKNRSSGFPTRFDTNRAVQSQKMPRGLKFRI